jgi:predicted PurR-regulated permease PerM
MDSDTARFERPGAGAPSDGQFYRRLGAVLLLAGFGYLVWRVVQPVWHPLVWAVLLGTLFAPAHRRLEARFPGSHSLAASVSLLLIMLLFVLPVLLIAEQLTVQASHLHRKFSEQVVDVAGLLADPIAGLPWLASRLSALAAIAHVPVDRLHAWLTTAIQALSARLTGIGGVLVQGAFGAVVNFMLMLFMLFFVLRDGRELTGRLVPLLPIEDQRRTRLRRHLAAVVGAVFLGIGTAALLHGLLIGIGAWLAGMPAALLIGVLAALLALIPVVGSALVWLPCVLYLSLQGQTGAAMFLAAWSVLLVGTIDHVVRPLLISGRASIPALPVFLGVIGGLHAFGLLGLFLGPILLSVLVALFRFEQERIAAQTEQAGDKAE